MNVRISGKTIGIYINNIQSMRTKLPVEKSLKSFTGFFNKTQEPKYFIEDYKDYKNLVTTFYRIFLSYLTSREVIAPINDTDLDNYINSNSRPPIVLLGEYISGDNIYGMKAFYLDNSNSIYNFYDYKFHYTLNNIVTNTNEPDCSEIIYNAIRTNLMEKKASFREFLNQTYVSNFLTDVRQHWNLKMKKYVHRPVGSIEIV